MTRFMNRLSSLAKYVRQKCLLSFKSLLKIDSLVYFIKIIFFHLFLRKYMYMVLMKLGSGDWHKLLQSYHKYKTRKILSYIRIILFQLFLRDDTWVLMKLGSCDWRLIIG